MEPYSRLPLPLLPMVHPLLLCLLASLSLHALLRKELYLDTFCSQSSVPKAAPMGTTTGHHTGPADPDFLTTQFEKPFVVGVNGLVATDEHLHQHLSEVMTDCLAKLEINWCSSDVGILAPSPFLRAFRLYSVQHALESLPSTRSKDHRLTIHR